LKRTQQLRGCCHNPERVCSFFLYFARFEYALKRTGYCQLKNTGEVRGVDWTKYARSLEGKFEAVTSCQFLAAVEYLLKHPPRKQVLVAGQLAWKCTTRNGARSEEGWILDLVRITRNNLFHGGKYTDGPVDEPARNEKLMESCLVVLEECLQLSPEVAGWFGD
jgi:hypothetical protein